MVFNAVTNSWSIPTASASPQPQVTTANPQQLLPVWAANWGSQAPSVTPAVAFNHSRNQNPYIPGTDNYLAYEALKEAYNKKELQRWLKYPDVIINHSPSKRRIFQPAFRMSFETLADISLRLRHTIIFIGPEPYYVEDIKQTENDFLLLVSKRHGEGEEIYKVFYNKELAVDLRSPEPQYISYHSKPVYLVRPPYRQQQQGISYSNSYGKPLGHSGIHRLDNSNEVIKGLREQETIAPWSETYSDLMLRIRAMPSIRLSKSLCAYVSEEYASEGVFVEYRGRKLGELKENTILMDEEDCSKPWIKREIAMVNCQAKVH